MLPDPKDCRFVTSNEVLEKRYPVIDVRTPEAHAACHLPKSENFCVYEVSFMERFPEAYPDKSQGIIVYGEGDPYMADRAAVGRLETLGYQNIFVLEGGLRHWKASGLDIEGEGVVDPTPLDGRRELDPERTKVRWVGRNLTNQHDGEVATVGGFLEMAKGVPVAGEVEVDLRKLNCREIADTSLAGVLIGHLQNADFFDVENYPSASFTLTEASKLPDRSYGQPNFQISGVLRARGKELAIAVDALVEPVEGGCVFHSNFDFDRVELGACYGSGKLFEKLGMHLVNDFVSIDVHAFFADP